jgi:hypothetical protein
MREPFRAQLARRVGDAAPLCGIARLIVPSFHIPRSNDA